MDMIWKRHIKHLSVAALCSVFLLAVDGSRHKALSNDNAPAFQLAQLESHAEYIEWSRKAALFHSDVIGILNRLSALNAVSFQVIRGEIDRSERDALIAEKLNALGRPIQRLSSAWNEISELPRSGGRTDHGAGYLGFLEQCRSRALTMVTYGKDASSAASSGNADKFFERLLAQLAEHARLTEEEDRYLEAHLKYVNPAGPQYGFERGVIAGNGVFRNSIASLASTSLKRGEFNFTGYTLAFSQQHSRMKEAIATGVRTTNVLRGQGESLEADRPQLARLAISIADSMDRAFALEEKLLGANAILSATIVIIGPEIGKTAKAWPNLVYAFQSQYAAVVELLALRQRLNAERMAALGAKN